MIGAALYSLLADETDAGPRVYPHVLPQSPTLPAVTYQLVSSIPLHAMQREARLIRARVQVDVWGRTYAEAQSLAAQVARLLNRYRGEVVTPGDGDWPENDRTHVQDILLDNVREQYEDAAQLRRITQDYTVFYVTE